MGITSVVLLGLAALESVSARGYGQMAAPAPKQVAVKGVSGVCRSLCTLINDIRVKRRPLGNCCLVPCCTEML
jgi:hypothetical protein